MPIVKNKRGTRPRAAGKKRDTTHRALDRRSSRRYQVKMQVDYSSGENFLFSYIDNISEVGIFIATTSPLLPGTPIKLRFSPQGETRSFEVSGQVVWINPYHPGGENINPGMGIKFVGLTEEQKQKIQELITTIAYIHENWI
jgi:type IV pilus assembly protein PilZ